ncbi:putative 3-hydroxyacyl-CoA dehydrogenase [Caenibius tardaugens NBRC 16725]|uniref:Putative 3-hydroxyacyl-CoA dehydrogenase n=1 Tax=Caenibius tardaugens NBRC 16725 TaxID=1219035 RepID=U2YC37_9SPHN|nr:SDR family NAD(P)-dependent oxidoreductase [Caenibius tardaugens]AZI35509.1 SDR family oxidoreductase [Caenibius tardaugens NBRC 16725]GAD51121.1 putative 3-hydroxyacyl-CoA dehydrogenase [Caenibius tardaugens NBRC 16725]
MHIEPGVAAVVTGGASGLGEATSRALAMRGAKLAIFDMDAERGEALAKELGGIFCQTNVCSDEQVDAAFAKARAAHGQERILVNCAGISSGIKTASRDRETGEPLSFPMAAFEKVVQINLLGTFRCIAAAAKGMLTLDPLEGGERGAIVCTASIAAQDGQIGQAAYAASKAGVVGLTLPVARDLMGEGIRINTILPGLFLTPMMKTLPEKVQSALAATVPFPRRLGYPAEFADLALHLISNAYMNGEAVRLDAANRLAPR